MGKKIGIIGAGAWGTGLATVMARAGHEVLIWSFEGAVTDDINHHHLNSKYLPDIKLPPSLEAVTSFDDFKDMDAIFVVTPTQFTRNVLTEAAPHIKKGAPVLICSKGVEQATGQLLSDVVGGVLPQAVLAVLSGPNFAGEAAKGLPAAATLACDDKKVRTNLLSLFEASNFRPYGSTDMVGLQVGAALKNVIAIACGITVGKELGENAKAALMTRGLMEITRFGLAFGAQKETFMGLSGVGDLVLTCSSLASRNFSLGVEVGKGRPVQDVLAERHSVAEGYYTAEIAAKIAADKKIDMPLIMALNAILHEGKSVEDLMQALLARPFRSEGV